MNPDSAVPPAAAEAAIQAVGGEKKAVSRTFKITSSSIDLFNPKGRYSGDSGERAKVFSSTPGRAAERAASALFKLAKASSEHKNVKHIKFSLQEVTRGSSKHTRYYEASEDKLAAPREIKRGDVVTIVEFERKVRGCEAFPSA
jgi:hypothetical protein